MPFGGKRQYRAARARRVTALVLALLMLLSLSGCGIFETRMARAVQKMSKLNNLHFTLSVGLDLALSVSEPPAGESTDAPESEAAAEEGSEPYEARVLPLQGSFTAEGELFTDPLLLRFDGLLRLPGSETRSENYIEKAESAYYLYSRTNDGTLWQKQGLAEQKKARVKGLQYLVKGAESFSPTGTETLDGRPADRYDAVIDSEYVAGLLSLYEVRAFLADGLGLQLREDVFDEPAAIPATLWLDQESGMIVSAEVDLNAFAEDIAQKQLDRVRGALDLQSMGLELKTTGLRLHLDLSAFDEAEAFQIPEEAKEAWGEETMPWEK